jgi:hypothetical protein
MKSLTFALALAVLPAYGQTPPRRETPVLLYTNFEHDPPASVVDALHSELEAIMRPIGLEFEWRSLSGPRLKEAAAELVVVSFKGRCDAGRLGHAKPDVQALGITHMSDGVILPFSDIDCDAVRLFVQRELLRAPEAEHARTYGRAVARVVAHELYHVLAQTPRHGSNGLAKGLYRVQELLDPGLFFEESETFLLRACTHPALQVEK